MGSGAETMQQTACDTSNQSSLLTLIKESLFSSLKRIDN